MRHHSLAQMMMVALIATVVLLPTSPAHGGESEEMLRTEIPHHDGSGRATIVEIHPGVPGARAFVNATPEPIPSPGELIVPPRATPLPSPFVPAPR